MGAVKVESHKDTVLALEVKSAVFRYSSDYLEGSIQRGTT